jgi:hypothetical protein
VRAFADPEIIRMAREDFIPVAGDDWYQRRREDAEGKFFRHVADQGPQKDSHTKQSVYCLTASGKLLSCRPGNVAAGYMRETLRQGLAAWKKLPEGERKPGAAQVGQPGKADERFDRRPPAGGLIVNVYARILDRDAHGQFKRGTCQLPGGAQASRDHLWITAAEWKSLGAAHPRKGDRFPMPPRLADRILRYHLVDNTRGEPPHWTREQVRCAKLSWTVKDVTADKLVLRLQGSALLATKANPAKADRGFDVCLLGLLEYDRRKKIIDRLDIVAVGDHWGQGTYTPGARPGRAPLGVAFELARGDKAADRVPPQGIRDRFNYLPPER